MRRVLSVAYTMIVSGMDDEQRAGLDRVLAEVPVVVETRPVHQRPRMVVVAAPQAEQEKVLLERGKTPPPWWPGAEKAARDSLAAGAAAKQLRQQIERRGR